MLGGISLDDFSFLVLCDMCGHVVAYESDTLVANEIVLCEDCRDAKRRLRSRFDSLSPQREGEQPAYKPTTGLTRRQSVQTICKLVVSPTPPSERTDGEPKDPTRATGTGGLRASIQKNRDVPSREPEKDKAEKRAVEKSGGQSVPPVAKQKNNEQRKRTRDKTRSHTKHPDAQNTMSDVPRTSSKQRSDKGCLSGTALLLFLGSLR